MRSRGSSAPSKRGATSRGTSRITTWAVHISAKRCTAKRCAASKKRWKSSRATHSRARHLLPSAAWSTEKVFRRQFQVFSYERTILLFINLHCVFRWKKNSLFQNLSKLLRCPLRRWFDDAVVNPQQKNGKKADGGNHPPDTLGLVRHFAELMHDAATEPAAEERADADGKKRKAHISALLAGGRQARNVFVVARRLNHFAKSEDQDGENRAENRGLKSQDKPGERGDESSEDHGMESGDLADQVVDQKREADDGEAVGNQDQLDVGPGADIAVDVTGEGDVLLPEDNPIAGEDQKEEHELWVGEHGEKIPERFGNARRGAVAAAFGLAEEDEHGEEHGENAEGGDAEDIFDAEMAMGPGGDVGAGGAADVHHGVVNGVADGADIFFRGARSGANDTGFHHGDTERGQNQDEADEDGWWDGSPHWSEPGCAQRTEQKVGGREDEISE